MSELSATGKIKRVQLEAVVTRADGKLEPLGVVADSKWRRWDPRGIVAGRRIRRVNKRKADKRG